MTVCAFPSYVYFFLKVKYSQTDETVVLEVQEIKIFFATQSCRADF